MSLSTESVRNDQVDEYNNLLSFVTRLEAGTQNFMDNATALHTELTDAADKAEVIAVRDDLIARLRVILGV